MASSFTTNPFESERLVYRAVDVDKDEEFFVSVQLDPIAHQFANANISMPQNRQDACKYMKNIAETRLLGVVICLKPSSEQEVSESLIPVGVLHLSNNGPKMAHHRNTMIGINIVKEYQGRGYGSEAIIWGTAWAFERAGMHRVEIRAFEFNERARHLYHKLGFTPEGRLRESFWSNGRFWDSFQFGMLANEWQAIKDRLQPEAKEVPP